MLRFRHLLPRSAAQAAAAQGQPVLCTPDTPFPIAGKILNLSACSLQCGTGDVHAGEQQESTRLRLRG